MNAEPRCTSWSTGNRSKDVRRSFRQALDIINDGIAILAEDTTDITVGLRIERQAAGKQ